jgi:hypothetical protein
MPVAMTFDSLKVDLRRYLERGYVADTEVYAQLPTLINLAERDIVNQLQILGLLEVVTNTMAAGIPVIAKPDRWRATASMNFGIGTPPLQERTPLFPRSYEFCSQYWPNRVLTDVPKYYADYDYQHWIIVPTPAVAYPFEVNCWQQPPLLDDSNQTNWLTEYAPNLLTSSSLNQCLPFLKDGAWSTAWAERYKQDLASTSGQDLQRILDRTSARRTV